MCVTLPSECEGRSLLVGLERECPGTTSCCRGTTDMGCVGVRDKVNTQTGNGASGRAACGSLASRCCTSKAFAKPKFTTHDMHSPTNSNPCSSAPISLLSLPPVCAHLPNSRVSCRVSTGSTLRTRFGSTPTESLCFPAVTSMPRGKRSSSKG